MLSASSRPCSGHSASFHVPSRRRRGYVFFPAAFVLIFSCFLVSGSATAKTLTVELQTVTIQTLAQPPALRESAVVPGLKEERFSLEKAINYKEMADRVGVLSDAQIQYLEKHRFLLLPRKQFLFASGGEHPVYNEMLYNFDVIGGRTLEDRYPGAAIFAGPDPFLHALHMFFSNRMKNLEQADLSYALLVLLEDLHKSIVELRAAAGKDSAGDWERLQAQMLVPLVLIRNTSLPGGVLVYRGDARYSLHRYVYDSADVAAAYGSEPEEDGIRTDSLENALGILAEYQDAFSAKTLAAVKTELERIYAADNRGASPLGLYASYDELIDYTQFKPRGHYESGPITRAYFRTMIFLGQVGWNLDTENGLVDAVNYALAMSHAASGFKASQAAAPVPVAEEGADHEAGLPQLSALDAWQRIMEITGFFSGYPDAPAYAEWQAFIRKYSGQKSFTADSARSTGMIPLLAANIGDLKPVVPYFADLQEPPKKNVMCILPQRFTIPWLIADKLTYEDGDESLPVVFSGLWVPGVLGSNYARSMVERQIFAGSPLLSEALEPQAYDSRKGAAIPDKAAASAKRVQEGIASLAASLERQPETSWFSSLSAVWLRLLGTLTAEYGQGYPLYMQDAAFSAKQLESLMGSFTELKHDNILYEKPNYAEAGEGGDDEEPLPVPKGFVEPNLAFWNSLLRSVEYMESGFQHYGLFPEDLEEYGSLSQFRSQVEFCISLAEKELRGEGISDEEYENLRLLSLSHMASPLDYSNVFTDEQRQSGLVVDVQTANLNDPDVPAGIVYEATGPHYLMLVLVGNETTPRLVLGVAYNHYEFTMPYGPRLTDNQWKAKAYAHLPIWSHGDEEADVPAFQPVKNFWYDPLRVAP